MGQHPHLLPHTQCHFSFLGALAMHWCWNRLVLWPRRPEATTGGKVCWNISCLERITCLTRLHFCNFIFIPPSQFGWAKGIPADLWIIVYLPLTVAKQHILCILQHDFLQSALGFRFTRRKNWLWRFKGQKFWADIHSWLEPREKKSFYFPLYWLLNSDAYNGLL